MLPKEKMKNMKCEDQLVEWIRGDGIDLLNDEMSLIDCDLLN